MYFHIGKRDIISKKKVIGIFSTDTINSSEFNKRFSEKIEPETKSIIIDKEDHGIPSIVTSVTLFERFNNPQYDECLFKRSSK